MTDDEKMDALLRQMAAEEYNRPPQIVPREQMWDAVMQGGTGKRGTGTGNRDASSVWSPGSSLGVLRCRGGAAARCRDSGRGGAWVRTDGTCRRRS